MLFPLMISSLVEYQITGLKLFESQLHRASIEKIILIAEPQLKTKILSQYKLHFPDQSTAIQENRGIVILLVLI